MKACWHTFELQLLLENKDAYVSSNLPFYAKGGFIREP